MPRSRMLVIAFVVFTLSIAIGRAWAAENPPPAVPAATAHLSPPAPAAVPPDAGYRSPGDKHKLQVSDPEVERQLLAAGQRLIGNYGSFSVFETDAATTASFASRSTVQTRDEDNLILLNAGPIDTTAPETTALRKSLGAFEGKQLHLVQFAGPIRPDLYAELQKTGVEVLSYIPNNAYLVYGDSASLGQMQAWAAATRSVQWEGPYLTEYRLDPNANPALRKDGGAAKTGDARYGVQLVNDKSVNPTTLRLLNAFGPAGGILSQWTIDQYVSLFVRLTDAQVKALAARPDVVSIMQEDEPTKQDERQDLIIAGQLTGNAPTPGNYLTYLADHGITAALFDFAVDVGDSGIDNGTTSPNHFALHELGDLANPSRVLYNRLEGTPHAGSTLAGCDGHGTLNANIICGYIPDSLIAGGFPHADSSNFRYGLGVAPFVKVGSSVIFDPNSFTSPSYPDMISRAYRDTARISSNSWGASTSAYTVDSQAYDRLTRDAQLSSSAIPTAGNQEMLFVFSAGNSGSSAGSVGSPGTAKNIVTVGASEGVQAFGGADQCGVTDSQADSANDIAFFSSRGPTADGRRKPDLVAPGTHITGGVFQANPVATGNGAAGACFNATGVCAGPSSSNFFPLAQQFYTASSGTSHSTPAVAGGAAIIRAKYQQQFGVAPSPAMSKAILMNTARYMTGNAANDTLWSNAQGMGMLNLDTVFDLFSASTLFKDQGALTKFTATGQQRTLTGTVTDPTRPFRVTLTWTDPPGSTTGASYINNLDLEVTVGGATYKGNVFSGAFSATGGSADTRNNAESVIVPAGVSGPFVVKVKATNIAGDGVPGDADLLDQDFALVVYNATEVPLPVLESAGSTLTAENCPNTLFDPGEIVTVNYCVQNIGTLDTANLVGTLEATGGVIPLSSAQTFGALTAGGAAVCQPFTFLVDPGLSCGANFTATLHFTDGATDVGNLAYSYGAGQRLTTFSENFDSITPPALPTGWTATLVTGGANDSAWTTGTTNADTAPNRAFAPDPNHVTDNVLDSPPIAITTAIAQLTFRHAYDLEANTSGAYDGGVLEIKIGSGSFQDILAAGGSFVQNGYTSTIDTRFSNPIKGRQAWSGLSGGSSATPSYITTIVNLPAAAAGQTVVLRWRVGTDTSYSKTGRFVDTIKLTDGYTCCQPPDTLPPDTSITPPTPDNPTNSPAASFTFTGTDYVTPPSSLTFQCSLDNAGFTACTSPQPYSGLSDGSHTFQVRAIDAAGNTDPTPASFTWTVDTTPPDTSITPPTPPNPTNSTSASFTFNGSDGSGVGVTGFQCSLDNAAFTACASPQSYSSLADGSHTFQVRAVDNAGNTDATPASFTWVVDTTAPDTSITVAPSNPTNSASASFSFTGSDGGGSGVARFECRLDGGTFVTCVSPVASPPLADGSHTFDVRAVDAVGNTDPTPASFTWVVDTVAPTITLNPSANSCTLQGNNGWCRGTQTAGFTAGDSGSGLASPAPCAGASCNFTQSTTTNNSAVTIASGQVCDVAGNCAASINAGPFKIDSTPPTNVSGAPTTAPNGDNGWYKTAPSVQFVGSDATSAIASCSLITYSGPDGAAVTVSGTCTDNAGNTSAPVSSSAFKVDATPPTLSPTISPNQPVVGGAATASPNAADNLSGIASQSCDPVDTASVGPKTLTCRATDTAGNTTSVTLSYFVGYTVTFVSPTVGPPNVNTVYPLGLEPWFTVARWKLTNVSGAAITAAGTVSAVRYASMTCGGTTPTYSDSLPLASGFSSTNPAYDTLQQTWLFNWQLPSARGCYVLFIKLANGQVIAMLYRMEPVVSRAPSEFNGDGKTDLLWRNTATNQSNAWFMNGGSVASYNSLPAPPSLDWQPVAVGDLNADGRADLVWRNTSTGQNIAWLMDGGSVASYAWLPTVADAAWKVVGVGDLNADGKADLVWYNTTTRQVNAWLMDGGSVTSFNPLPTLPDQNWQLAAIGDLNADGKADLVWRNTSTGENAAWLMDGGSVAGYAWLPTVSDGNWKVVGTGDLNGDGKADLIWRNTSTGENVAWLLDGGAVTSYAWLPTVSDQNWKLVAVGDANGDGKTELIWRNTSSGQNNAWLMDGTSVTSYAWLPTVTDMGWRVISPTSLLGVLNGLLP